MDKKIGGIYKATIICHNCRYKLEVDIPKGKTKHEWKVENKKCPICECSLI